MRSPQFWSPAYCESIGIMPRPNPLVLLAMAAAVPAWAHRTLLCASMSASCRWMRGHGFAKQTRRHPDRKRFRNPSGRQAAEDHKFFLWIAQGTAALARGALSPAPLPKREEVRRTLAFVVDDFTMSVGGLAHGQAAAIPVSGASVSAGRRERAQGRTVLAE